MDENSSRKPSADAEDDDRTKADMNVDEASAEENTPDDVSADARDGTTANTAPGEASESGERAAASPRVRRRSRPSISLKDVRHASNRVRSWIASIVWIVAAVCAAILALGAVFVALDANQDNSLVIWFQDTADTLAGPFGQIFEFERDNGSPDTTKNALVNWGIAAAAYLIIGRIIERIIRP